MPRGFDAGPLPAQASPDQYRTPTPARERRTSRAATGLAEPYFDTTSSTPTTTTAEHPSDQADRASPARKYPSTSAMTGFT